MATWQTKVDARAQGAELLISGEAYTIGADVPNVVILNELPLQSYGVTIAGFTEVAGTPASATEFKVEYAGIQAGYIRFHAAASGSVAVTYKGRGSSLFARDVNRLQAEKVDLDRLSASGQAVVHADNLTTGTLPDARLSTNVVLIGATNKFTTTQEIQVAAGVTALNVRLNAADTWAAYALRGNGTQEWGAGGASSREITLARTATGVLTLTGTLNATALQVGGTSVSLSTHNHDATYARLAVGNSFTGKQIINQNATALDVIGTDSVYLAFYRAGGAGGRSAYFGYASAGTDTFSWVNERTNGGFAITANGTGIVSVTGTLSANGRIQASRVTLGFDGGSANTIYATNWFRSKGNTGWYSEDYAVGLYADSSAYLSVSGGPGIKVGANGVMYEGDIVNDNTFGLYFHNARSATYAIYRTSGAWGTNPKLSIAFTTGIRIGADKANGGTKFFNSSTFATEIFSIGTTDDNIRAAADIIAFSASDRRLKDEVLPLQNAVEAIRSLSGVRFRWNSLSDYDGTVDVGVIAQEVERVLPEVVTTRANGYKAVKYEKLVPLLIQAIKELDVKVTLLEAR